MHAGEAGLLGPAAMRAFPSVPVPGKHKTRRGLRQGNSSGNNVLPSACGGQLGSDTLTTLGNGYLGSRIDEERSEMRYLV